MKQFIISLTICLLILANNANAHIVMTAPLGRSIDAGLRDNPPCGGTSAGPLRLSVLTKTFFTTRFTEMLPHGGVFNVNLLDANGNLIEKLGTTPSVDPFVGNYNVGVTPSVGCKNCILQVEFVTTEPDNRIYYQCADVSFLLPGEGEILAQSEDNGTIVIERESVALYFAIAAAIGVFILGIMIILIHRKTQKTMNSMQQIRLINKKNRNRV